MTDEPYATRRAEVEVRVIEKMKATDLTDAVRGVGADRAMYEGFAEGCLRLGQAEAAAEWIDRAAQRAVAEETLKLVDTFRDEVREFIDQLRRKAKGEEIAAVQKDRDDRARRKRWAEKRQREKLGGAGDGKPA